MTDTLRTPEGRFAELPGFPWPARYVDVQGMRMAYLDAGPADADVVLCLRGEPTWSYLYRKMIPVLLQAGLRVVAPDWLGVGRSNKPANDVGYTWDLHHGSMLQLVDALALRDVTLVVQDWGGMLELTFPVSPPELVKRLPILNTGLGVGTKPTDGFLAWRDCVANTPDFNVGELMARAEPFLTPEEVASYNAPFPDARYKVGVRRFPALVPTDPDAPGVAVDRAAAWWATVRRSGVHGDRDQRPGARGASYGAHAAEHPGLPGADAGRRRALRAGTRRADRPCRTGLVGLL